MCGIAGIYAKKGISNHEVDMVKKMNIIQKHRGPDDEGLYQDNICALGHRRLSIIDLSDKGHQPFSSEDQRYQLVYNGEIYNYIELREELKNIGWTFITKTDTEVLLKAYQQYGSECLNKFNGMFAFVIYDSKHKSLFFARDRVGIKPLYYLDQNDIFCFSSEIKALRGSIHNLNGTTNYQAVFDYLVFNRTDIYDETFINEIKRIPKGHFGFLNQNEFKIIQWWNPEKFILNKYDGSINEINRNIDNIFSNSAKLRMRSDVNVGSCLSGGMDSSILTGVLFNHNQINGQYLSFTSSFPNHPIDETSYIDKLNMKYPFTNHRTYPDDNTAFDNFEQFTYMNDEPVFNSSFYSQYEVMRLAKENNVTVLLDGQGGDENFAGYQYFHGFYLRGLLKKTKYYRFLNELIKVVSRQQDKSAYQTLLFQFFPDNQRKKLLHQSIPYISKQFFYEHIDKSLIYNNFFDAKDLNTSLVRHFQYKLEHLLRMEDRNSMAFSIEARVPYLDHNLIEFLLSVPEGLKIKAGQTKYLQKTSLGKYTIPEIINRTDKIGFGTPRDEWMQKNKWVGKTHQSLDYLKNTFPGILKENCSLPESGLERWKINQLATWNEIKWN